ncbi:uncharacterized protein TRIVIDRAFT_132119, partial [Trichoderma virens Gv29-8]
DETSRQRLLLAADILDICGKQNNLCLLLLKDGAIKSLNDVALKYYSTKDKVPGADAVRAELLFRVPTAVLSAVVDNDILALDSIVRDSVSRVLKLAIDEQFDVRSGTLGLFMARPACQDELSKLSAQDAQAVRTTLESLYRLHPLVVDAEHLGALIGTRYTSARVIASSDRDEFIQLLEGRGLSFATAARIHLEAERIDRRNDAFWADIVRTRREVPVLAISGLNQAQPPPSSDDQDTNLTTLFNDLDSVAAENSTSVLGPASYLVDLLKMLSTVNLSIKTVEPWTIKDALSALDVFLHRRPDIATTKLSKVDTETPMAYQDLAIEVMEQYLSRSLSTEGGQKVDVYAAVSQQLAPMTAFPYSYAILTTRELLQARGYSRYELLRRFQSDQDLVRRAFPGSPACERTYAAAAENLHERRLAAESLKLQPLDFQAITQEALHSPNFVRLLQGYNREMASKTYREVAGLRHAGEYWGYEADPVMVDSASGTSLRLIKEQLLIRSGLSPSELNMVLKTRYIGKRLVVTLASGDEFSDRLQDMRLQESPLIGDVEGVGRLSERTCLDLQAFIRLYHRLGWSIEATDAAIAALARRAQIYEKDAYRHHVLDGGFIERLAAANRLSTQTNVPLTELLPLWGPMDAQFPSSLYTVLFLRPGLVQQYPSLNLVDGETLVSATFGQNMGALLQALRLTQADLLVLMKIVGFGPDTHWSLGNIAQLYSHQLLSRLLNLPISRYSEWWSHCEQVANPFMDPQSTLVALDLWLSLPEEIPSVEAALNLLVPVESDHKSSVKDLALISQMVQGMAEFLSGAPKLITRPKSLNQGQPSLLEFSQGLSLQTLSFSTSKGEASFNETSVFSASRAKIISHHLSCLERCLNIAETLKLGPEEVNFYRQRGVDLFDLKLNDMRTLLDFLRIRKQFGASGTSLVGYCQYLQRASRRIADQAGDHDQAKAEEDKAEVEKAWAELVAETRQVTKLTAENISIFFNLQWPSTSASEAAMNLLARNLSPLQKLADCCEMSSTLAVSISTLHQWSQVSHLPTKPEDFDSIGQLKASLSSGNATNALTCARESLASTQQRVLQEALLRLPEFKAKKITTPDDLSAELLIDVKMGPAMQTSRIAQAIASVQLFVQRSHLGLEKLYGLPTTAVKRPLWSWMSKYTLWQANRKVFLYPENWADPSLRDDKTPAFEELESKMLQMNLNKDLISQLLREYVYAVHEVADLDVQSYLWEATRGFRGNYHFFARTRTAPFDFYYRRLEVTGASAASVRWNWLPWSKMEVEIPTHEVDADHKPLKRPGSYLLPALFKNRLFLFIPQITRQTKPAAPPTKPMMEAAQDASGSKPPEQYWEVKMAWVEMRNGKWSPKYVTATGINVEPTTPETAPATASGPALPSIASFRFRLETRNSGQSLAINVDKWKLETDTPAVKGSFQKQGSFEMQGLLLRLVETSSRSAVGSSIAGSVAFSRISHKETTKNVEQLRKTVQNYAVGIDPKSKQKSLLTVPNPKSVVDDKYELTWLLTYDDSQFNGTSGLVVERSTSTQVESFFGYPDMTAEGEIDTTNKTTVTTHPLTHEASLSLVEEIADKEGYECIFEAMETLPKDKQKLAFGYDSNTYSELATPSSVYNWELGFHTAALLMERLLATQQFDLAIEVSRLVFDPPPKPLSRLDKCWRFIPFKSSKLRLAGSVRDTIQRLAPGEAKSSDITDWEANPFSPHAVARNRPAVYMKRFVMKCIEILIASGDQYFRQNSLEAVPLATQRYVEASALFGPAPIAIDPPTKPVTRSYDEIRHLVNDFATASVDMELEFPHFINPIMRGGGTRLGREQQPDLRNGTLGFVRSTYFGVPANPQMQALRDLIDDRLYKIRNGLDINGNPRRLPLFDPPLDPGQLVAALSSGAGLSSFAQGLDGGPMPNYRARYLLQKALDLCGELRGFSDSYLSIRERQDAEAMANLRAKQETGALALMGEVKRLQVQEASMAIDALEETRKSHVSRLQYYLALLGEPTDHVPTSKTEWVDFDFGIVQPNKDELRMSQEEWLEWTLTDQARHSNNVATCIEQNAGILMALPSLTVQIEPMGVGTSSQLDASIIARGMMAGAGVIRAGAQASTDMAFRVSRKGQLVRQLQERKLQANMAGRDIQGIDKQIASQKKRIEITQAELRAHQQQAADAADTEAWLRSKYTSEKLYSWLEVQTRKLAYQVYLSALDMAKTAERATMFEYGPRAQSFLSNAYWDESRDGLLSAQQLTAALHRMEKFYIENTAHDYELTKTISLRQTSPLALIDLRTKGVADFEIPEVLFDHDFPGHYCRRIKSISVTIPSIIGPYTGVNCTLRLLEHRYRLKAGTSSTGSYYLADTSNDERFHTDSIPITSIALSTCNHDSGAFELNFNGDRYVPFEGAGVISRWKLELPGPFPQFDYHTISDVLFTVQYTALEGGAMWKQQASDAVRKFRSELKEDLGHEGALLLVDLRADFPNEW